MLHSFPFYIADWRESEKIMKMSCEERGLYLELLIVAYWHGSLPTDERSLCIAARCSKSEFRRSWTAVQVHFFEQDGRLHNARVDAIRPRLESWREARREAGSKGGKSKAIATAIATAIAQQQPQLLLKPPSSSSSSSNTEPPIVPQPAAAAPSGAGCVSLSLFGELPSDQPEVVIPPGTGTGTRAALLADYAERIYAAHPAEKRTLSRAALAKRLGEITKGVKWGEPLEEMLTGIEQRHSGWCGSRKWQQGYAPGLKTHFGPSGGYDTEPPSVGPSGNGNAAAELMARVERDAAADAADRARRLRRG